MPRLSSLAEIFSTINWVWMLLEKQANKQICGRHRVTGTPLRQLSISLKQNYLDL